MINHRHDTKIFCITLKSTPERQEYANVLFRSWDFPVEFFYGVDGSRLNVETYHVYETTVPEKSHWRLRNGVIGAGLSHLLLWNVIRRMNHDEVMILEDDVEFTPDFRAEFEKTYEELPQDWEMFYLGGKGEGEKVSLRLRRGTPTGMYGYMVKKSVLTALVHRCSLSLIDIDCFLSDYVLKHINCYVADPRLVTEKSVNNGNMPTEGVWKSLTYDWK